VWQDAPEGSGLTKKSQADIGVQSRGEERHGSRRRDALCLLRSRGDRRQSGHERAGDTETAAQPPSRRSMKKDEYSVVEAGLHGSIGRKVE
jgi:hypothetical protein